MDISFTPEQEAFRQEVRSWIAEAQAYGQSYINPVVLGQVMTENDPDWSVFWCQGSQRTSPPSSS